MVVVEEHLDGCGFLLMDSDSNYYQPLQLPEIYKVDQCKVLVQYTLVKNRVTICLKGKTIDISSIKKVK